MRKKRVVVNRTIPKHIKTRKVDENGCWVCDNVPNHDGYIRVQCFEQTGKLKMLHVAEWEKLHGPKPANMEVNHKCGNRGCCNPSHLELLDGSEHATHTNINRVGYTMNRMSDEDLMKYYWLIKFNNTPINEIVRLYGIKRSTMSSIVNKKSRTHLTDLIDKNPSVGEDLYNPPI